ncbi:hypothetical protein QJS04_geneDACA003300 [Acorus gramineus]|uniref:Uncharacterized protein n=1 Tax=Acorus gramineus TaxID=55184 RepID=A0AAV9BN06_ACOGR|nr:hypothetical protein QJS04_geneDACA003300 [Acorus gramineus]
MKSYWGAIYPPHGIRTPPHLKKKKSNHLKQRKTQPTPSRLLPLAYRSSKLSRNPNAATTCKKSCPSDAPFSSPSLLSSTLPFKTSTTLTALSPPWTRGRQGRSRGR